MKIDKRRRREGKTDYKLRLNLLKSGKARVVFRKTNKYVIGQYNESDEARDKVIINVNSKELLKYGWKETVSIKSISACYLTGFLLGKKIKDRGRGDGIFDIGLLRNIKGSKVYAFLKGVIDAGVNIKAAKDIFPDEKRIKGEYLKNKIEFDKIKENLDRKFV